VTLTLPIPIFDPKSELHASLAEMAVRAEEIAAGIGIDGMNFVQVRQAVRRALEEDGVAADINARVARLLGITVA